MTTTGVTVLGRIVYEGKDPPNATLRVTALPPSGSPLNTVRDIAAGRVNREEGTFELPAIAGPQMIRVQGIPLGWVLNRITIEGKNITDVAYDFGPANSGTELVITLTDRLAEINGSVRDSHGGLIRDYVLVVFPEDPRLWGAHSRYVQTTRPNQTGSFWIKGLPPGRYLAAVVPTLENGIQNDPTLLEQLRPRARSFSLAEGQTLSLNLEVPAQ